MPDQLVPNQGRQILGQTRNLGQFGPGSTSPVEAMAMAGQGLSTQPEPEPWKIIASQALPMQTRPCLCQPYPDSLRTMVIGQACLSQSQGQARHDQG